MEKIVLEVIPMTGNCDENTEFMVKGKVKTRVSIKSLSFSNEFLENRIKQMQNDILEAEETIQKNLELINLIKNELTPMAETRDRELAEAEGLRKKREADFLQKQEDERKRDSESN